MVAGLRGDVGGGEKRGSDKHTRYSNSPSCLCPPVLSDREEIVKRERDRDGAVVCVFLFLEKPNSDVVSNPATVVDRYVT